MLNMKGLSPLLASVLLIAIVIIIGSFMLDWTVAVHTTTNEDVKNKTGQCTSVAIAIDKVYLNINDGTARVVVRNAGFDDDTIRTISITNNKGIQGINLTELPISIPKGEQKNVEVNLTDVITHCSNFSRVFVTTDCGISAEYGDVAGPICNA
jgi:flagellin-like protein